MLRTRDGWDHWATAGGQNMRRVVVLAVHRNRIGIDELTKALNQGDAVAVEAAVVTAVNALDVGFRLSTNLAQLN